jgi:hypothetical protein
MLTEMGIFRLANAVIGILTLLPTALMLAAGLAFASLVADLPEPFESIGGGIRGVAGRVVLESKLGERGVDVVSLDTVLLESGERRLTVIAELETPPTSRADALATAAGPLLGSLSGPLAVADGVREIDLLVRAAGGGKTYANIRVSTENLLAWGERRLTDAQLLAVTTPLK